MASFLVFGTGDYFAARGSGQPSDPFVPSVVASGSPASAYQAFGAGAYFAAASGSGTKDDPYVPLVSVLGRVSLEDDSGLIELENDAGVIVLQR